MVENKLHKIFDKKIINEYNFLDTLIANRYTWHCGGMSDPFQPVEEKLNITHNLIEITNKYGIHILFSTKSDSVYLSNINPKLHSFQLSITNINNNIDIEPNVPSIEKKMALRLELEFNHLFQALQLLILYKCLMTQIILQ